MIPRRRVLRGAAPGIALLLAAGLYLADVRPREALASECVEKGSVVCSKTTTCLFFRWLCSETYRYYPDASPPIVEVG